MLNRNDIKKQGYYDYYCYAYESKTKDETLGKQAKSAGWT